jgi:osmotically inducible lipoprotein OsmB
VSYSAPGRWLIPRAGWNRDTASGTRQNSGATSIRFHHEESTMSTMKAVAAAALALSLAACSGMTTRDRDTLIGAGVGAAAGAAITGGDAVGTVGGAAVGGVIGNQVGKH